ncbi:haloacid dehalogenase-like hydrolase, partial [Rhodobacteraceae bacterium F11138]|nr:haloacid dehalogenase-like hydrolase [Rhodobacteraceae bacterium F11138]MBK0328504.1 haloacid dehalogenase-like hydrolase [Rhodobacteraceae bacterium F11138]MBK0329293.1 haloacid dehalogenase-like hydrolase [Rhodobacteraceae bacterium F11138]MBK0329689.1 haloacid dehalogenase-like hydrolase [Rhodobacteraceae bacterium F11138]
MKSFAPGLAIAFVLALPALADDDPLPSWNEGDTKRAIIAFVRGVTDKDSDTYVGEDARIATFDNDGTLWIEQPMYTQLAFALDRVKEMADDHPEWKTTQPFQAVLEGDMKALGAAGEKGLLELVATTHAGMSTERFAEIASDWLAGAKHPKFDQPYTALVYQPMLELIEYLQDNDFETFIVSGGGIEFMRPWTEEVYGIPPQQVVGSSIATEFKMVDGKPALMRTDKIDFIDDKAGKPVGINAHIGHRPIAAFGNSDGDFEMLQYTTIGADGLRLGAFVHHTDAEREYAYDRETHIGKLDKGLDAAAENGWLLIDMKTDWKTIFPQ